MPTFTAGVPYTGTITVNNATSATVSGLPTGISVTSTTQSGTDLIISIAGTPTVGGEAFNIQVNATNACGGGQTTSTSTGSAGSGTVGAAGVCPSPSVGSLSPLVGTVGTAYSGTLVITNATSGTITNLPAGLSQSGAASGLNWTITVTGTPTVDATTALLVDATNACGGGQTTSSVTGQSGGSLVISPAAAVPCPTPVTGDISPSVGSVGSAYTGTVTVTNATSATITNLPAGLSQSGAQSGLNYVITVTGTPTSAGTTALLVNATNACGGGQTTTTANGLGAGAIVVSAAAVCPSPTVGTISTLTGTVGTAYSGTLTVLNATSATITNLPAGLSQSGSVSGADYVITVSGTPTTAATTTLLVDAINACGTGTTSSVSGQSGGALNISAASYPLFSGEDCCGVIIPTAPYTLGTSIGYRTYTSGCATSTLLFASTNNPLVTKRAVVGRLGSSETGCGIEGVVFLNDNDEVIQVFSAGGESAFNCSYNCP